MKEFLNEIPFSHISHCGTKFRAKRCDFRGGIEVIENDVTTTYKNRIEMLMKDTAEMIGWHACNIRPELNGFSGYVCLNFEFVKE